MLTPDGLHTGPAEDDLDRHKAFRAQLVETRFLLRPMAEREAQKGADRDPARQLLVLELVLLSLGHYAARLLVHLGNVRQGEVLEMSGDGLALNHELLLRVTVQHA